MESEKSQGPQESLVVYNNKEVVWPKEITGLIASYLPSQGAFKLAVNRQLYNYFAPVIDEFLVQKTSGLIRQLPYSTKRLRSFNKLPKEVQSKIKLLLSEADKEKWNRHNWDEFWKTLETFVDLAVRVSYGITFSGLCYAAVSALVPFIYESVSSEPALTRAPSTVQCVTALTRTPKTGQCVAAASSLKPDPTGSLCVQKDSTAKPECIVDPKPGERFYGVDFNKAFEEQSQAQAWKVGERGVQTLTGMDMLCRLQTQADGTKQATDCSAAPVYELNS